MFDTIPTVADRDDALELLRLMRCPTTTDRIDMLAAELATRRAAAERAGRDGAIEAVKSVANDLAPNAEPMFYAGYKTAIAAALRAIRAAAKPPAAPGTA